MRDLVNIVMASNENYVPHLASAIASIIANKNHNTKVTIFILHAGLKEETLNKIKSLQNLDKQHNTNITPMLINNTFSSSNLHGGFSIETLFRLYLPSLLENIDKVIYLDPDLVVMKDLADLYNTDLENYYVAGVKDLICLNLIKSQKQIQYKNKKMSWVNYYKAIGLKETQFYNYLQAGVLVFNLKKIREDNKQNAMVDAIQAHGYLFFNDQDAINIAFKDSIKYLDIRYNFTDPRGQLLKNNLNYDENVEYNLSRDNPYIIHYTGKDKPWNFKKNYILAYWETYWQYRQKTPFAMPATKLKLLSLYNIIRSTRRFIITTKENKTFFRLSFLGIDIEINWAKYIK